MLVNRGRICGFAGADGNIYDRRSGDSPDEVITNDPAAADTIEAAKATAYGFPSGRGQGPGAGIPSRETGPEIGG